MKVDAAGEHEPIEGERGNDSTCEAAAFLQNVLIQRILLCVPNPSS